MAEAEKPAKKPGLLGKILMPLALFVFAGAGAAGGAFAVLKLMPPAGDHGGKAAAADHAPAPAGPLEYVELENAFTANLMDSGRYLQVKLSLSTFGGPEAAATIGKHKPALVSAVLATLGDCSEADIADHKAKDGLRERLKDTINAALKSRGEPGQVEEVFFTSLVAQ
jgi:flagellar basal body-associated protein FliL